MTLIVTQISKHGIIHASDSNLSDSSGDFVSTGKKLFEIPRINSAITIAGDYSINSTTIDVLLSSIIQSYDYSNIREFAFLLKDKLDKVAVDYYAMFHLCGYVEYDGKFHPEFWFIRNMEIDENGEYTILHEKFVVEEQFWSYEKNKVAYSLFQNDNAAYQLYINGYTEGRIGYNKARFYIEKFYHSIWNDSENKFRPPININEAKLLVNSFFQIINLLYNLSSHSQIPIGGAIQLFAIELPKEDSDL